VGVARVLMMVAIVAYVALYWHEGERTIQVGMLLLAPAMTLLGIDVVIILYKRGYGQRAEQSTIAAAELSTHGIEGPLHVHLPDSLVSTV
jgi:hypothetical protein